MPLDFAKLGVGSVLKDSLYSDSGKLLLRRGSIISQDILERLQKYASDVRNSFVDSYSESLPGSDISRHGCKPYDDEHLQRLQWRFESASETVADLATAFVDRKLGSADSVQQLASDYIDELASDMDQVLAASSEVPEDQKLAARCIRMGLMCMAIGLEMDLPKQDLIHLGTAGMVHDWGLFTEPAELRYIHPSMTLKERIRYTRHSYETYELLQTISRVPTTVMQAVVQTHERLDGSGFPNGLRGDQIKPFARILAVADCYLSLTAPLGNLPAVVPCDAVAYILGQLGKSRFDPSVIRGFLQSMAQFPIGSLLQLSDDRQVKVLRGNGKQYGMPIVQDLLSGDILDLTQHQANVVKPILRHDPSEYRLKPEYRRLVDSIDLPEYLNQGCFVNATSTV